MESRELVGRASELAQIERALSGAERPLWIVGPGGIGKTALARAAMERATEAKGWRSRWVDLEPVRDAERMRATIAAALGAPAELAVGEPVLARIVERAGLDLVVFDNVEQIEDAERVVAACGARAAIVTSRNRPTRPDATVLALGPLACGGDRSDAGEMLTVAIRRTGGDPALETRASLEAIAARVEGVPLALELVARRVSALGAVETLGSLEAALEGDGSSRHAGTEACVRWSWELLDAPSRAALARLSTFAAPFTIEAAATVLGVARDAAASAVLDLYERSLVVRRAPGGASGPVRFAMLGIVRAFAWHALLAGDDIEAALDAHASWIDRRVRDHAVDLDGPDGARAAVGLHALRDELGVAIEWAGERRGPLCARLLADVAGFFTTVGMTDRERSAIEALAANDALAIRDRAPLLVLAGIAQARAGRLPDARALFERGVALAHGRDPSTEGWAAAELARIEALHGAPGALERMEHALDLLERHGPPLRAAMMTSRLGSMLGDRGEPERGERFARRGLERALALGSFRGAAALWFRLATLLFEQGRWTEAIQCIDEASRGWNALGNGLGVADAAGLRALALHDGGELDRAEREYARAATLWSAFSPPASAMQTRGLAAALAGSLGDHDRALDELARAAADLEDAGARRLAGLMRAHAAIVEARAGRPTVAAAMIREASRRFEDADDPVGVAVRWLASLFDDPREIVPMDDLARAAKRSADVRLLVWPFGRALGEPPARRCLRVSPDGAWFVTPRGRRVSLARRPALRAVLGALVRAHGSARASTLDVETLFASAWPGERAHADSARARVHTSVHRLRDLDLDDVIVSVDQGYAIDPALHVLVGEG